MEKELNDFGFKFTYTEECLTYDVTEPMSLEEGVDLLHTIKLLFDAKNICFYLGYGTLLGAVRDHSIIPGDEDLDIIIKDERALVSILPFLKENGLYLIRAFKGNVYSFRKGKRSYIDVYILRDITPRSFWSWYCYSISNKEYCPKKYWKEIQNIEFLGDIHLCPKDPERILAFWYGNDWRIPKSGHNFYYEVKSHWFWMHKLKPFLQKAVGWPYWRHLILKRFKNQQESLLDWRDNFHD